MQTEIIIAVISAASSAAAAITVAAVQHKKTVALLEYRLLELEKKVDKHNNLVERTYELEKNAAVHSRELKALSHRLNSEGK